jgi:predicted RNA-binding protein
MKMCESTAYLLKNGTEDPIVESVALLEVEDGQIKIVNLYGEERKIKARVSVLSLVEHKIILEPQ